MANPTGYYQWTFPNEYQDPWDLALQSGFSQIDATVRSVSQLFQAVGRTTLVVSINPSTPSLWALSVQTVSPANADFHSASCGPYGELTGTVTVPYSGAIVRFELFLNEQIFPSFDVATRDSVSLTRWRMVTAGSSLNLSTDSAWRIMHRGVGATQGVVWTALSSLGMGTHTVTLETVGQTWATPANISGDFSRGTYIFYFAAVNPAVSHNLAPLAPLTLWATLESI